MPQHALSSAARRLLVIAVIGAFAATLAAVQVAAQTSRWQLLRLAGTRPPALQFASATYDPDGQRMLMFGGYDDDSRLTNDLWALTLAKGAEKWMRLLPEGVAPPAAASAALGYAPDLKRMVVFGDFTDTWVLDFTTKNGRWSQPADPGAHPVGRYGATLVYQPPMDAPAASGRFVLFGGASAGGSAYNDTWVFDARPGSEGWTELTPCGRAPRGRITHTAVADVAHHRMVVFGGSVPNSSDALDDVWALDLTPGLECWTELQPTGNTPTLRDVVAVYDPCPGQERQLVFGGAGSDFQPNNSAWQLTLDRPGAEVVSNIAVGGSRPPARARHVAIFDLVGRRMVISSGYRYDPGGDSVFTNDTWALESPACIVPSPTATLFRPPETVTPSATTTSTPTATQPEPSATPTSMPTLTTSPTSTPTRTPARVLFPVALKED